MPSYLIFRSKKKYIIQNKERTDFHLMMFHGTYIKRGEKGNIDNKKRDFFWQEKKEEMIRKNIFFHYHKKLQRLGGGVGINTRIVPCLNP